MTESTQQSGRDGSQPRQVIPDVSKSAEIMGIPIMGIMRAFMPSVFILFYGINMAPPGMLQGLIVGIGVVVAAVTTFAVFAAPEGDDPWSYIWYIVDLKTGQGVLRHE